MVGSIKIGIGEKLTQAFGSGLEIRTDGGSRQEQDKPFFSIRLQNPSRKPRIGNRYLSENPFQIEYAPAGSSLQPEADLDETAQGLLDALEYIQADGALLRGTKMRCEKGDGVLRFFVNYNLHLIKTPEEVAMEELTVTTDAGKG